MAIDKKISERRRITGAQLDVNGDLFPVSDMSESETKQTVLAEMWSAIKSVFATLTHSTIDADSDFVNVTKADGSSAKISPNALKSAIGVSVADHSEYLSAFHKKIMAGSSVKIVFSGDSTTSGTGTTTGYTISELVAECANLSGIAGVSAVNRGQSGKNTQDWLSTYLTGDLALSPDLLVLRWGINDALIGDADEFEQALRAGLSSIRESLPLDQLSILLMTPNTTSETSPGANTAWHTAINTRIRKAAADFQCAFIDTYRLWIDSVNASDYMDTVDGQHIHPASVFNVWIASQIVGMIFPSAIKRLSTNQFINTGITYATKNYTDLPSTYPLGLSIYRTAPDSGSNFVSWYDGIVITHRNPDGITVQKNIGNTNGLQRTAERYCFSGTWTVFDGRQIAVSSFLNSWVAYNTSTHAIPCYWRDENGLVHVSGLVKSGTTSGGDAIFNLSAGYRPSRTIMFPVASNNAFGCASVTPTGDVCFQTGSNAWFSLDGICFYPGQ